MKSLSHSLFGQEARNWRWALSSGQVAVLSGAVVFTPLSRMAPFNPHQPGDRTACHLGALPQPLSPDLAAAAGLRLLLMHPQDLIGLPQFPVLSFQGLDALRLQRRRSLP